jgi:phage shock protein PspC (stress-responsive transcriptional regulator)
MRRDQNKVVAGVCAGVAQRLGIDPNVVRVVTVVLAIFGGAGILLYAAGWLLLPEERTGLSLGERALRGGAPDGVSTILLALALLVVTVGVAIGILSDSWFATAVLVVAVGIGVVLLNRRPTAMPQPTPPPTPGVAPPAPPPTAAGYPAYPYAAAYAAPYAGPGPTEQRTGYEAAPEQPPVPRRRAVLGPVTAFAALAVVGLLGLLDARGASVPVAGYVAAALAVVGTGLVVGTWFGRSRGLIALGVALVVLLVPIATVERLGAAASAGDAFESVTVVPDDVAEIDGTRTEYAAGDVRYDLTALDFSGERVDLEIRLGAGELVVAIPDDVTLVLDAQVGAGEIDALGERSSGLGVSTDRTFDSDASAGTLVLDVSMGLGSLEVIRETA